MSPALQPDYDILFADE